MANVEEKIKQKASKPFKICYNCYEVQEGKEGEIPETCNDCELFKQWVKLDEVLQILADYVVISRDESVVQLIEKVAVEELEKKHKIIPLSDWRELLKLAKPQEKDYDFDLLRDHYVSFQVVKGLEKQLKKIEEKLEDMRRLEGN